MKVIAAQHNIKKFANISEYKDYYTNKINAAKAKGAELYVLPEYCGLELTFTEGETSAQVAAIQEHADQGLVVGGVEGRGLTQGGEVDGHGRGHAGQGQLAASSQEGAAGVFVRVKQVHGQMSFSAVPCIRHNTSP